jgi:riboflavin synthase
MFTGIVAAVGGIKLITPSERGVRVTIDAGSLDMSDVAIGDSIAVNGACLTVVEKHAGGFAADVSAETLRCTHGLGERGPVNLEKSLRLSDRLGGHLLSGHVDGVGKVRIFEQAGESWTLAVEAPAELAKYIAAKGSITVDGVSLTVNRVAGAVFEVNVIPHTLSATNFRRLARGADVNLEVDMLARYLERLRAGDQQQ